MSVRLDLLAVAGAVLAATPLVARADDYFLAAGESDSIAAAATYDSMTVNGDLSVSGGKKISVNKIDMAGGSITVTGSGTTLGTSNASAANPPASDPTSLSMTNGVDGSYGMLNVFNTGVAADKGLALTTLYIRKEGEDFVSDNGYFDFLALSNGTANIYAAYNYSSATGRISVAGTSGIFRRNPRYNRAIFRRGAYRIDLADDSTLTFNYNNQGGYLNEDGCVVDLRGAGAVRFVGSYQSTSYSADVNRGACINNTGPVDFARAGSIDCYFSLNDSGVIGPNVTALRQTEGSSSYNTRITIASGVTITLCGDVQITGKRAYLTGGRIKIDAAAAARSFQCHIKEGDSLVVEKVGANEMVVSSTTNMPKLVVQEGVVRFTEDCVVGNLTMASGAAVIADGCVVTLQGEIVGASLGAENGGCFVKAAEYRVVMYDPWAVTGALHVANGELAFSKHGFNQKWWRWTFFSINNGPRPLLHRGLYLFGTDGAWQSPGTTPTYVSTPAKFDDPPTTALAENRCRWWRHSTTNLVASDAYNYNYLSSLSYFLDYSHNGNNRASLSSPVINPDDPTSWVGIEYRLPSTAKPITGYNMRSHATTYYANGWKVEASSDGLNWETVDIRSNQTFTISSVYNSYDNKSYNTDTPNLNEFFHFTGYRHGGLAAMDPLSVQVDDGATIDLLAFDDGQPIDSVTIDLAAGGGTVKGGRVVPNGTLILNGVAETGADISNALPLAFEGTLDAQNFRSWKVVIDGKPTRRHPVYANGRLSIPSLGMRIIVF